jgi:endonuclease III related protein
LAHEHRYLAKEMPAIRILPSPAPFRKRPRTASASSPALTSGSVVAPACPEPRRASSRPAQNKSSIGSALASYFDALSRAHGPQHWWPGRTRFEIIVGAILTQNTSWTNVERAIVNLRREKLLSPAAIEKVPTARLAKLIRSSGYFRQKARKLKAFVGFLRQNHQGSLNKLFATPTSELREQLLGVHGIGPETADSILLYAGQHRVFVVDAYTRRILERHGLTHAKATYEEIRARFERNLPADTQLYNEYHALIVHTGKHHCRARQPNCADCPLQPFLPSLGTDRSVCATIAGRLEAGATMEPASAHSTSHESPVTSHEQ